jgi:HSP20 family protein
MNSLDRWNWLKDLETFQHSMDSLLSRSPTHRADSPAELKVLAEWSPLMEIIETDKEYLIQAELPELTSDDVKVSAESGTLTIIGQRKFEAKETAEKHHGLVPVCGSFGRTFLLPDDVSPGTVSAEIKDGVLVVRLIKVEKAKPQQVEIEPFLKKA